MVLRINDMSYWNDWNVRCLPYIRIRYLSLHSCEMVIMISLMMVHHCISIALCPSWWMHWDIFWWISAMFYPRFHRCPTFVRESWLLKQSQTHAVASIRWRFVSQSCEDHSRCAWMHRQLSPMGAFGTQSQGLRNSHILCVVPRFSVLLAASLWEWKVYGQVRLGGVYGVSQHFCLHAFHLDLGLGSSSCKRSWTVVMPFVRRRESLRDTRAKALHVSSLSSFRWTPSNLSHIYVLQVLPQRERWPQEGLRW